MADGQSPNPNASSESGNPTEGSASISKHQWLADRRMEIEGKIKLQLHLKEWEKQLKEDLLKIETYRNRCIAAKAELYQLMSFYILIQGVVFGALSNGSKLTCQTSFFPASFSFLTSVATAISVHYKLGYYKIEIMKFIRAERSEQTLVNKINKLRIEGIEFKFGVIDDSRNSGEEKQEGEAVAHKGFFYWAVMLFLFVFSCTILASCIFVQCFDTQENKLRLCALHKCLEIAFH